MKFQTKSYNFQTMGIKKETGQNLKAKFSKHTLTQFFFLKKKSYYFTKLNFHHLIFNFFCKQQNIFFFQNQEITQYQEFFFKTTIT